MAAPFDRERGPSRAPTTMFGDPGSWATTPTGAADKGQRLASLDVLSVSFCLFFRHSFFVKPGQHEH